MAFPTKEVWVINCHTGCTCCSNENFTEGPYLTEENAIKTKLGYEAGHGNPLASQYAKYGTYSIDKWEVEVKRIVAHLSLLGLTLDWLINVF